MRDKTKPFMAMQQPARGERLAIVRLGHDQAALRNEASDLGEQVEKTVVFERMHGWVNEKATRAADRLRQAAADPSITADQSSVALMLHAMADALHETEPDEPFTGEEESGGGAGGGGAGGGQGERAEVVPSLAELKLLRGAQQVVYQQTRALESVDHPQQRDQLLQQISVEQGELADLGQRLIEKARSQQGPVIQRPEQP